MDDRAFWILIKRALLMAVAAIDARHGLGRSDEAKERTASR
jgi:hypothetical protein